MELIRILIMKNPICHFFSLASVVFLSIFAPLSANAGDGSIDSSTGNMEFEVNFRYPPSTSQITDAKKSLTLMSQMICDATDGQVQVTDIRLTGGAVEEDKAAFWYYSGPFRSGGSIFSDGSSLTRLGSHLSLSDSAQFRADILAHEMGHHAFGLGEQYDEQSRFGGNCGIGRGFEAANLGERDHSLMQQSGSAVCVGGADDGDFCRWDSECGSNNCQPELMSEFSVVSNHDLLQGNSTEASCTDSFYTGGYNTITSRWESTMQTLWHGGDSDWETLVENYSFITAPAGKPIEAPQANCFIAPTFDEDISGSDQVLLVVDRSDSMSWSSRDDIVEVCDNGSDDDGDGDIDEAECAESRISFVAGAGRAFIDLQRNAGIEVGLQQFNASNNIVRSIAALDSSNANAFKTDIDNLNPSGTTAIGSALEDSLVHFNSVAAAGRSQTAFLLTDGYSNSGPDPESKVQDLKDADIRMFTIPAGSAADVEGLSELAAGTGAYMIAADPIDELTAIYAELAGQYSGAGLILPRTPFTLLGNDKYWEQDCKKTQYCDRENFQEQEKVRLSSAIARGGKADAQQAFELIVEKNADALVAFISGRNQHMNTWSLNLELHSPDGSVFKNGSPEFVYDPYYIFFRIPNPAAGSWKLIAEASSASVQESIVLSFVENPKPKLLADVRPRIVDPSTPVSISASPIYAIDIEGGISLKGKVTRPDGSVKSISLVHDKMGGTWTADFNDYVGNGVYEVTLDLNVNAGAKTMLGESIFDGPERMPIDVVPFVRSKTLSFHVIEGSYPECKNDDCDGDGIPNKRECGFDTDKDGVPNVWDTDSDNDEIPDSVELLWDKNKNGIPDSCDNEKGKYDDLIQQLKQLFLLESRALDSVCDKQFKLAIQQVEQSITTLKELIEISGDAADELMRLYEHQSKLYEVLQSGKLQCEEVIQVRKELEEISRSILAVLEEMNQ